jgi:hypothetical protein
MIAKSEKADNAPPSGNQSIRKCQGDIGEQKDKARDRRYSHIYNYKMNIMEGGCHSRATRFAGKDAVCINFWSSYMFDVIYLFGCLKKLIWCDIKDDITKLDSLGFKK